MYARLPRGCNQLELRSRVAVATHEYRRAAGPILGAVKHPPASYDPPAYRFAPLPQWPRTRQPSCARLERGASAAGWRAVHSWQVRAIGAAALPLRARWQQCPVLTCALHRLAVNMAIARDGTVTSELANITAGLSFSALALDTVTCPSPHTPVPSYDTRIPPHCER